MYVFIPCDEAYVVQLESQRNLRLPTLVSLFISFPALASRCGHRV